MPPLQQLPVIASRVVSERLVALTMNNPLYLHLNLSTLGGPVAATGAGNSESAALSGRKRLRLTSGGTAPAGAASPQGLEFDG